MIIGEVWNIVLRLKTVIFSEISMEIFCYNDTLDGDFEQNKHRLTEVVAYTLYGVYHIIMVTIMLNMLIAMMSNTLSRIQVY